MGPSRIAKTENYVFGGVGLFGALGSVGTWLLQLFGWVSGAEKLQRMTSLWNTPEINWPGIWFLALLICAVGLILTNYEGFIAWRKGAAAAKRRTWDAPLSYAIRYIADESWSGESLRGNETRYAHALLAIQEAAERGSVRVGGKRQGSSMLSEIPPRVFKKAKLTAPENSPNPPKVFDLKYPKGTESLYREMFLDTREMKNFWIRKGGVVVKV